MAANRLRAAPTMATKHQSGSECGAAGSHHLNQHGWAESKHAELTGVTFMLEGVSIHHGNILTVVNDLKKILWNKRVLLNDHFY